MAFIESMISTTEDLQAVIQVLSRCDAIAVDTEFYWRHSYYPELCLIQIATQTQAYLIDALSEKMDLTLLGAIFSSADICKIMHAADNDIKILKHALKAHFCNIFDTQLATAFTSTQHQISLQSLLFDLSIVQMDKQEKLSDWRDRPLTQEQIDYATSDVIYLYEAYQQLTKALETQNKLPAFNEEMQMLCETSNFPNNQRILESNQNLLRSAHGKKRKNLIALILWREQYAQQKDWVVRHILDNRELTALADLRPKSSQDILNSHILSSKKAKRFSSLIIDALDYTDAEITPFLTLINTLLRYTYASFNKDAINDCYDAMSEFCREKNLAIEIVTSKSDLRIFIKSYLTNPLQPKGKLASGWRFDYFGKSLIQWIGVNENRL
ncbi:ribonuclease D [Fangia hongkongensis]|uniref:ribonuclease D n=1 Tax=Fangia hongkongensis TaxID=270495 RepID=UPI000362C14E|nr:ribonuclease D [Fangia hongkongensis]